MENQEQSQVAFDLQQQIEASDASVADIEPWTMGQEEEEKATIPSQGVAEEEEELIVESRASHQRQ